MYQDVSFIKKHQIKLNMDDQQYAEFLVEAAKAGRQPATFAREATALVMKYKLWQFENLKRMERAMEEAEKERKAA
jgi:hypothetical protein